MIPKRDGRDADYVQTLPEWGVAFAMLPPCW